MKTKLLILSSLLFVCTHTQFVQIEISN